MLSKSHIVAVVPVTDLARSRQFYEGVLGLTVVTVNPDQGMVIFESAGTHLMIYRRTTASSGEHTVAGFDIEGDFDAVVDGLIARGVKFDTFEIPGADLPWDDRGVLNDGIRASVWFKDPDGNVLSVGKGGL